MQASTARRHWWVRRADGHRDGPHESQGEAFARAIELDPDGPIGPLVFSEVVTLEPLVCPGCGGKGKVGMMRTRNVHIVTCTECLGTGMSDA